MRKACGITGDLYHRHIEQSGYKGWVQCRSANTGHDKARGVRWSDELQVFEMKCDRCYTNRTHNGVSGYWPITPEFWSTTEGVQECRACIRDRKRKYMARRRAKCTVPWDECRCGMPNLKASSPKQELVLVDESRLVA